MSGQKTRFVYVTFIAATPERVFEAIVQPDVARRYWAHENVSDWRPGSRWDHVRADADRTVEITGTVVECVPPERLVISWAAASASADPSSHSRVTFDVAAYEGMTRLTLTHDELVPESKMAIGIAKGWPIVLSSLKSYLETGSPLDVFARPAQGAATAA